MTRAQPTPEWMARAACLGVDPETFFPVDHRDAGPALAICKACPVRSACLDYVTREGIKEGVWGGLTEAQRSSLRGWRCVDCGTGVPTYRTRRCRPCAAEARKAQKAAYRSRRAS